MNNPYLDDHEQATQKSERVSEATVANPVQHVEVLTAPMHPLSVRRQHVHRRPRGCLSTLMLAMLIMLFTCVASFAIYVAFPPQPLDILVMGLDSREGEGKITRTDSIMLIGVDTRRLQLSLLSIPRDLFITMPGYGTQRINTINFIAEAAEAGSGPAALQASIAQSFNVQPDRFVRLDFQAFVALVDAVGGVSIDVPRQIIDYQFPTADYGTEVLRFEQGVQQMDGTMALKYARTRHADDDYQRASRQQQVLRALAGKLLNPLTWPSALNALNQHVETDVTIVDMLVALPPVLFSGASFDQLVIDRDYIVGTANGAAPNYDLLEPWLQENFD